MSGCKSVRIHFLKNWGSTSACIKLESVIIWKCLNCNWNSYFSESEWVRVENYRIGEYHLMTLTLSYSDTFQFWHFLNLTLPNLCILYSTLSNSDTLGFWHLSFEQNKFWHFQILTLSWSSYQPIHPSICLSIVHEKRREEEFYPANIKLVPNHNNNAVTYSSSVPSTCRVGNNWYYGQQKLDS